MIKLISTDLKKFVIEISSEHTYNRQPLQVEIEFNRVYEMGTDVLSYENSIHKVISSSFVNITDILQELDTYSWSNQVKIVWLAGSYSVLFINNNAAVSNSQNGKIEVRCPGYLMRHLIGKNGSNIKYLTNTLGLKNISVKEC